MRRCVLSSMVLAACAMFMGCGSVVIGSPDEATEATPAAAQTANTQDSSLDCDALMQALADSCFKVTAFQEDGTTPLHEVDEAGNDLGEVDQNAEGTPAEGATDSAAPAEGGTDSTAPANP